MKFNFENSYNISSVEMEGWVYVIRCVMRYVSSMEIIMIVLFMVGVFFFVLWVVGLLL